MIVAAVAAMVAVAVAAAAEEMGSGATGLQRVAAVLRLLLLQFPRFVLSD